MMWVAPDMEVTFHATMPQVSMECMRFSKPSPGLGCLRVMGLASQVGCLWGVALESYPVGLVDGPPGSHLVVWCWSILCCAGIAIFFMVWLATNS